MIFTSAQVTTLKSFLQNNEPFKSYPLTWDGFQLIVDSLSLPASPDFFVYRTNTPIQEILNAISWANFTPANPTSGAGLDSINYLLACQGKQFNLQNILTGGGRSGMLNTALPNIQAGLQDCLTLIPSDVNGTTKSGGWVNVKLVIQRKANILEKLFATGVGSSVSPATMVLEGVPTINDIQTFFTS
jgi:hypothetical protein